MIHIHPASPADASAMASLLNEIIEIGGTTARVHPVTAQKIRHKLDSDPARSSCHVAVDEPGQLMGFQELGPHPDLPTDACDIATFVRVGATGLGIGSKLFDASCEAARALKYTWINATIRADNAGGLAYYQSRGFEDYGRDLGVKLADGQIVDKVHKRFDL